MFHVFVFTMSEENEKKICDGHFYFNWKQAIYWKWTGVHRLAWPQPHFEFRSSLVCMVIYIWLWQRNKQIQTFQYYWLRPVHCSDWYAPVTTEFKCLSVTPTPHWPKLFSIQWCSQICKCAADVFFSLFCLWFYISISTLRTSDNFLFVKSDKWKVWSISPMRYLIKWKI